MASSSTCGCLVLQESWFSYANRTLQRPPLLGTPVSPPLHFKKRVAHIANVATITSKASDTLWKDDIPGKSETAEFHVAWAQVKSFPPSEDGAFQVQRSAALGDREKVQGIGRREALLRGAAVMVALASVGACPEGASALGSSFLKDRLKERKKDTFQILLYPIEASRVQLEKVHALLDSSSVTPAVYSEAKDLVQVSSRDCMPLEHYTGSQTLQAKFFEVCTFKLLVKNAVSLVDKADPKRVRAQQALVDLNRAFSELDDALGAALSSTRSQGREQVLPVVVSTQKALDELENGIRDALGAPPRVA